MSKAIIVYGNVVDSVASGSPLIVFTGTASSTYPITNLKEKSKNVYTAITPSSNSIVIFVDIASVSAGSKPIRGGAVAGHNFPTSGALKVQAHINHISNETKQGYQDIALLSSATMTGDPNYSGTKTLSVWENGFQQFSVASTAGMVAGNYLRQGTTRNAIILEVVSGTVLKVGIPSDGVALTGTVTETTANVLSTNYDTGNSGTVSGSSMTAATAVTVADVATYPLLVAEINADLTTVTATLSDDNTYIRLQSNVAGSPTNGVFIKDGTLLAALDGGNGAVIGYPVTAQSKASNIVVPYNTTQATTSLWGSPYADELLDFSNDIVYGFGSPTVLAVGGSVKVYVDTGIFSSDVEIGRIIFGNAFAPQYNFSKNYTFETVDSSEHFRTEGGVLKVVGRPFYRKVSLPFSVITENDKNVLMDLQRVAGMRGDIALSMFPEASEVERRFMNSFIGKLSKAIAVREIQHQYFSATIDIEETN